MPSIKKGQINFTSLSIASAQCGSSSGEEMTSGNGISLDWGSNTFDYSGVATLNPASDNLTTLRNQVYNFLNSAYNGERYDVNSFYDNSNHLKFKVKDWFTGKEWEAEFDVFRRALDHLQADRADVINRSKYQENWRPQYCPEQSPNDPTYDPWTDPYNPLLSQTENTARYDLVSESIYNYNQANELLPQDVPDVSQVYEESYIGIPPSDAPTNTPIKILAKTTDRGSPATSEDMTHGTNGDLSGMMYQGLLNQPEQGLWDEFTFLLNTMTIFDSELKSVAMQFRDNFRSASPVSPFEVPLLNQKVAASQALQDFIKTFLKDFNIRLANAGGNLNNVTEWSISNYRPVFNGTHNKWHGLQILINDTQQTEVSIQNFTPVAGAGGYYWADIIVTIRDHFGLDKNDALTYQKYPLVGPGFASWWYLQHIKDYQPFETRIVTRQRIISHY